MKTETMSDWDLDFYARISLEEGYLVEPCMTLEELERKASEKALEGWK